MFEIMLTNKSGAINNCIGFICFLILIYYFCFKSKDSGILGSSRVIKKKHNPDDIDATNNATVLARTAIALIILFIISISSFRNFIGKRCN